jgi:hypothetical protein
MKRVLGLLMLVALLPACGSGGKKAAADSSKQDVSASSTTVTGGASRGGKATSTTTSKSATNHGATTTTSKSGAAGSSGSTTTTTKTHVPLTMKLNRTCARRGLATGDTLTLTAHTDPHDYVGYSTAYSNGHNEMTDPQWKDHGNGYVQADQNGNAEVSWTVPDDAPLGTATLYTLAQGTFGPKIPFTVVAQTDHC